MARSSKCGRDGITEEKKKRALHQQLKPKGLCGK